MKTLQELTLLNKFLFDQVMDIPEAHEAALQIIRQDDCLSLQDPAQTEKEIRTAPWLRSIRLDVYAIDHGKNVYNTEMQAERKKDLLRRSRFYQGLIDSSLLEPGTITFNRLNDTYLIMITPFDLFGQGRYRYTFRTFCVEDRSLELKDGATRIFLNTKGLNDDEVSKELTDFLHYIERTDDDTAERSDNPRIKLIHQCVKQIKASEEMGVKYMQSWEEKVYEREQGRLEGEARGEARGRAEGEARGRAEGEAHGLLKGEQSGRREALLDFLAELGTIPVELRNRIAEETDTDVLKRWIKLAARSDSIADFCQKLPM